MIKKALFTILIFLSMSAHSSNQCGVVIDFPPGGTSDRYARLLQKYNSEYKIEYRTGGMAVPAAMFVRDNPNFIYLGSPVLFGDKSPLKDPPYELYKILIAAPILAVTTKELTASDILKEKLNIGVPGLGTSHHLIAEQIKSKNPNIQIVPTGGDAKALPLIVNKDLDIYLVSATTGLNWLTQFSNIKNPFKVEFGKPTRIADLTLHSVGFNGAFIAKNIAPDLKLKVIDCLETVLKQPGWTTELTDMGAGPVQIGGVEKDKSLNLYVEFLRLYDKR